MKLRKLKGERRAKIGLFSRSKRVFLTASFFFRFPSFDREKARRKERRGRVSREEGGGWEACA